MTRCQFVPPYLLARIAAAGGKGVDSILTTVAIDEAFREQRASRAVSADEPAGAAAADTTAWTVHTAGNTAALPGTPVRSAGQPDSGDTAVDEAAAGITASLALFDEVYGRRSFDGEGAHVSLTVHYEQSYANAFWDGRQLVFGDGDGQVFDRFTKPVDVLAHEFTHAVTEHAAGLVYRDQPGALNESMSDVFASCLKQRLLGQSAEEADWLIGEGLFLPGVGARALRDLRAPGTAYDDPVLGRDPQGGHMDDYVDTTDDNGGVHLNSGIPNRAFQLSAVAIGGSSWEGAGRIWYAALTGPDLRPTSDFPAFAAATTAAAGDHADAVREAWAAVGVVTGSVPRRGAVRGAGPASGDVVEVRRSGGFMGRTTSGIVDLAGRDDRADEVRRLVERIDLGKARGGNPHPDMFVYSFRVRGNEVSVPEQHLTDDLRSLARLVLESDR